MAGIVTLAAGPPVLTLRVAPLRVTTEFPNGVPAVAWVIKVTPPLTAALPLAFPDEPLTAAPFMMAVPGPVMVSKPPLKLTVAALFV